MAAGTGANALLGRLGPCRPETKRHCVRLGSRDSSGKPRAPRAGLSIGPGDLARLEVAAHDVALTAPNGRARGAQEPHGGVELVVTVEEAVVFIEHAAGGHTRPFVRQSLRGAGQAECAGRTGDARRV